MDYTQQDLESAVFRFLPNHRVVYEGGDTTLPMLCTRACETIVMERHSMTDHDVSIIRQALEDLKSPGSFRFYWKS